MDMRPLKKPQISRNDAKTQRFAMCFLFKTCMLHISTHVTCHGVTLLRTFFSALMDIDWTTSQVQRCCVSGGHYGSPSGMVRNMHSQGLQRHVGKVASGAFDPGKKAA